ncbi:hypothetical protein QP888_03445 [Corynebacterium sp. MSK297]|uniref:hypothetical protein n=1 Tax=Corynebacterium sp. MSK297 TaxID=3050221 RepID=UPI00254DDD02|nr:hypothetical protein [Corynebacterium sp. MSK297]MDK8845579.1 hypothetical protein [Corynebacterium sp. MSK297]
MSIAINRLLNDFQQCLAELAVVSGGSYLPPAGVIETMREAAGRVDGLDSAQLIAQSSAASGARRNKGDGFGFVLDILSSGPGMQLAGGGMEALLRRFQRDHEEDQVASQEFADGAQACGRALDDIRDSSEIGLSEILGSAIPIVQLVTRLVRLHPIMRLTGMVGTLASMVIEPAVANFMRTVGDRDDAICGCYEEFLRRCEQLCDKELVDPPALAPDASGDGPDGGDKAVECPPRVEKPVGGPLPANESAPPQPQSQAQAKFGDTSSQTTPVAEKPDFTKPVPEKLVAEPCPPGEINEPGPPQKAEPESALPKTPSPESLLPEPALAEEPLPESPLPEPELPDMTPRTQMASSVEFGCDVAKSCVGQIARAGLGMAMVGAQLVQETAAECLEQFNCQPPQPEPAPQPVEPECPPEQQPAPEPEPDCPPEEKSVPEPQPEPEPDCPPEEKTVPEPTPEPMEKPAPEPEPAPEPTPEPEPAPVPEDEVIEKPMPEHSVDKKQFHSGPAQLAPEPQPEPVPEPVQSAQPEAPHPEAPQPDTSQPQPDPQPEPAPAQPEQPASPDQDGGENTTHEAEAGVAAAPEKTSGNTHRMGQW